MKLNVLFLGRCNYEKALDIQYKILKKRQQGEIGDTLILVEHDPVITLGRNAISSNIIAPKDYLYNEGITVFNTNRGGDVTYHGYGQIVGYAIVDLKSFNMGIRDFVRTLEQVFIQLLQDKYHIKAVRDPDHTGVWVENKKITAIGLAVKRGITMHGFALNVNTNLEHFKLIIPCGITDKGVTSISKLMNKTIDFTNENKSVLKYFCKLFSYDSYKEISIDNL